MKKKQKFFKGSRAQAVPWDALRSSVGLYNHTVHVCSHYFKTLLRGSDDLSFITVLKLVILYNKSVENTK